MMVMEDMLKDFLLGEHLLLVGNQVSFPSLTVHATHLLFINKIISVICFIEISFVCTTERSDPFFDSLFTSVCGFYGHMSMENENA